MTLAQLSPENLDRILAHDRWKTEAILENNLQIEEMRNRLLNNGGDSERKVLYTQEDIDFNRHSSYSECNDSQIKRVARTKVKQGALMASQEMWADFLSKLLAHSAYHSFPHADKREPKLKTFLNHIVYYSLCVARSKKWPDAKDKASLLHIRQDFEEKCMGFKSSSLEAMYDCFIMIWPDYFDKIEFSDILNEVDEVISSSTTKTEEKEKSADIKSSPLFVKIANEFPAIDLDLLESYHIAMSGKCIEAALRILTLDFIKNRPSELNYTDEFAEWSDTYINHLHKYKETWKNKLKEIETDTWDDQIKWNKALTS